MTIALREPGQLGRGSHAHRVRILGYAFHKVVTAKHLVTWGVSKDTAHSVLRSMHITGLLYVSGWRREADRGLWVPEYRFRHRPNHVDKPYPGSKQHRKPYRPRPEVVALASLVDAIRDQPRSAQELADITGMGRNTVYMTLRTLHEVKLARIAEWAPRIGCHGTPAAGYQLGGGADLPRPAPVSKKEIYARQNAIKAARREQVRTMRMQAGLHRQRSANSGSFQRQA